MRQRDRNASKQQPDDGAGVIGTAIVGAGAAGTYAAWRLVESGHPPGGVALFEASERIGGRLLSVSMPGADGVVAEFGGMRFLTEQRLVNSVAAKLGLAVRDFPQGGAENPSYLRGVHLRVGDVARAGALPYRVRAEEQGRGPAELIVAAVSRVLPDIKHREAPEWARAKQAMSFEGRPLTDWGFWNFLGRVLSDEALQFAEMGLGYSSVLRNWNAADAVALIAEYVASPHEKTLAAGMQALPSALAEAVRRRGGMIACAHKLVSLRVPAQTGDGLHALAFDTAAGLRVVRAHRVIVALPPRAIALIEDCAALKDRRVAALLATVTPRPLGKVCIAHREAWWRPLGLTSGGATTDLPLRQIYYFGTEPGRPAPAAGFVTMGYFDRPQLDYWSGLRRLEQPGGTGFAWLDPRGPVATEVSRQVGLVHGVGDLDLAPLSVGFMNWTDDPFGAAWHTWNQGVKSWEVMKQVAAPVPGSALYIAGEAWSADQGWVEGALQTAETAVQAILRHPVPAADEG